MSEPVIRFHEVSKWYGGVSALKSVTVDIPPGIVGLLGPNGAGKTTFLRIVTGMMRPSRGAVRVLGQPVWNNPRLYAQVGYAPEADAFYEFLTGRDFLVTLLGIQGVGRAHASRLAAVALEKVDLADVAGRKIYTYSRGMRQRLKIAQAIAHEPRVLFLDEPLSGTDPIQRKRLMEIFREMGRQGRTILISSHVLHEVEQITRNFVLIHKGRVVAVGDVREIRELIDRHPHGVVLETDEPRRLAAALCGLDEVKSLEFDTGRLKVLTHVPDRFYSMLPGLVLDSGVAVREIYSPDDNLEAVFRYLVQS
ncbi:MAG: ABC transporter ATP-binding protein [Planctomycetes bacterium]|nr:ABC transporter ATP-binding protein [Planctomycetota bacterium]